MATIIKKPKKIINSLSAKAGVALWKNLGPKTKKRIITTGISIIARSALRSAMRKTTVLLFIGAIVAGAIFIVNNQEEDQ